MRFPDNHHRYHPSAPPDVSYRGREVSHIDLWEIDEMLTGSLRNPNTCISKGQLHQLAQQLMVRNHLLEKQVTELLRERGNGPANQHP